MLDRRTFLKGLVATAAGVLVPGHVAAEPERRIWALDRTMVASPTYTFQTIGDWLPIPKGSIMKCDLTYEEGMRSFSNLFVAEVTRNPDGSYTHLFTSAQPLFADLSYLSAVN